MNTKKRDRFNISFIPTSAQLDQIYTWLEEEEQGEKFAGSFCNWNSILYSFKTKEIAIICDMEVPLGFITWLSAKKTAKIQIAEIKPDYRKQGLGKMLTETVLDHLKKLGIFAVSLHCQPQQSEQIWKKIGFKNFPEVPEMQTLNNEEEGRQLYKILVPHQEPLEVADAIETLELWPVESYMRDKVSPKWFWNIEFKENSQKLTKPIIIPAKNKWNICWKRDGQIIKENDIKHFSKSEIHFDIFLMIIELA